MKKLTRKNLVAFSASRREAAAASAPRTRANIVRIAETRRNMRQKLKNAAKNIGSVEGVSAMEAIKEAKRAYYETGQSIMSDDAYDILETAAIRDGEMREDVGIRPEKGVPLPTPMTSLRKIKPGEDGLRRFLGGGTGWIVSEKLDGISALWHVPAAGQGQQPRLYLRGDAYIGTDVSQYIPYIKGLVKPPKGQGQLIVRGELVLRKADAAPGTPARSQVNGWLHKAIGAETARLPVRFVAYQLIEPAGYSRVSQFRTLSEMGFEVAWNMTFSELNEAMCVDLFKMRREASPYDTDGIVVAPEGKPVAVPAGAAYPTDMVAFKMPSADQIADTRVIRVEWRPTRLGILAPRIEIEPVEIGGTTITYVTGHNARFIETNRIGPGAVVRIRRSGDVIPIVDAVLDGVAPGLPEDGTWVWQGVHIARATNTNLSAELEKLKYAMKVLEVDGAGGATIEAVWKSADVRGISDIVTMDVGKLVAVLGKTLGPRLQERLKERLIAAPIVNRLLATGLLPPGVGLGKLEKLIALHGNPVTWSSVEVPSGWGAESWGTFIKALPAALTRVNEWNELVGIVTGAAGMPAVADVAAATPTAPLKGEVCFTGFRDKAWEKTLRESGWGVSDSVKRTLSALIIPDKDDPATYSSSKADKARQYNIRIYRKSEFPLVT